MNNAPPLSSSSSRPVHSSPLAGLVLSRAPSAASRPLRDDGNGNGTIDHAHSRASLTHSFSDLPSPPTIELIVPRQATAVEPKTKVGTHDNLLRTHPNSTLLLYPSHSPGHTAILHPTSCVPSTPSLFPFPHMYTHMSCLFRVLDLYLLLELQTHPCPRERHQSTPQSGAGSRLSFVDTMMCLSVGSIGSFVTAHSATSDGSSGASGDKKKTVREDGDGEDDRSVLPRVRSLDGFRSSSPRSPSPPPAMPSVQVERMGGTSGVAEAST